MIFVEGNHKINSFYMDMYEMDEHTYCQLIDIKNYHKDQMYYPVTFVDFIAAIKFCNLLSIKEGFTPCYSFNGTTDVDDWHISVSNNALATTWKDDDGNVRNIRGSLRCNFDADGYRLPTIEEWLYAAKGGKKPDYYNFPGSNDVDSVAVTGRNAKQVQPSGTLAPNKLGLYDLCGNIGEWCWDIKDRIYSPVCGGSVYEWFQLDGFPDSSWWKNSYRQISYYSSGFRVVRSAPKEENE